MRRTNPRPWRPRSGITAGVWAVLQKPCACSARTARSRRTAQSRPNSRGWRLFKERHSGLRGDRARCPAAGRHITDAQLDREVLRWANGRAAAAGRARRVAGFGDPALASGLFLLDLLAAVAPGRAPLRACPTLPYPCPTLPPDARAPTSGRPLRPASRRPLSGLTGARALLQGVPERPALPGWPALRGSGALMPSLCSACRPGRCARAYARAAGVTPRDAAKEILRTSWFTVKSWKGNPDADWAQLENQTPPHVGL